MSFQIVSSYRDTGIWLRGNLHTHTTNSDGEASPIDTIKYYQSLGYDFLAITDHDFFCSSLPENNGFLVIPAAEITAGGPHLVVLGTQSLPPVTSDRQEVVTAVCQRKGISLFCHPNWESHFNHCAQEVLESVSGYIGIEIVNHVCCVLPGSGYALDRWDRLLAKGIRVWGFANDDAHTFAHVGKAWNMVQCDARTVSAILDSLKKGRFYASTGVEITKISSDSKHIHLKTRDVSRIIAYGDSQRLLMEVVGDEVIFQLDETPCYSYVRFECLGFGGSAAWTQPFFVEKME